MTFWVVSGDLLLENGDIWPVKGNLLLVSADLWLVNGASDV